MDFTATALFASAWRRVAMLGCALFAAFAVWLSCECASAYAIVSTSAPPALGWLHASGTLIENAGGAPVQLRGLDEGGMYSGQGPRPDSCGTYWKGLSAQMAPTVAQWGFNSVRLYLSWANLEPTPPSIGPGGALIHHWDSAYVAALDAAVASMKRAHVYLIPTMTAGGLSPAFKGYAPGHCEGQGVPSWVFPNAARESYLQGWCELYANQQEPGSPVAPLDGFIAAWKFIAARYAGEPTVSAIDIMNEPAHDMPCIESSHVPSNYLDVLNGGVGAAIRSVDPNVLLILEGQNHSNGAGAGITRAGLSNVVYTWHFYPQTWALGQTALANAVAIAKAMNAPLYIGEFDLFGGPGYARPSSQGWLTDTQQAVSFFNTNGISWAHETYRDSFTSPNDWIWNTSALLSALRQALPTAMVHSARVQPPATKRSACRRAGRGPLRKRRSRRSTSLGSACARVYLEPRLERVSR